MADNSQRIQNYLLKGERAFQQGNCKIAIDMFKIVMDLDITSKLAKTGFITAKAIDFKDHPPAKLQRMWQKLKNIFAVKKAQSLLQQGQVDEAQKIAYQLLDMDPFCLDYIALALKTEETAKCPDVAKQILGILVANDPYNDGLLRYAACYYMLTKCYNEALDVYKALLDCNPNDQSIIALMKTAEAKKTLVSGWEQHAGKVGGTRDLIKDKGQAEEIDLGNKTNLTPEEVERVAAIYIKKINDCPNDLNSRRALARLYMNAKQYCNAVAVLDNALSCNTDPELDKMRSTAKLAEFDELIEEKTKRGEDISDVKALRDSFELDDLTSRVERYPNDAHLRFELGNSLINHERYDDAIRHLQIAQKSPKDRVEALYLLGKCFVEKGQCDLGVMQLETALDCLPAMNDLKKKVMYQLALCDEDACRDEKAYERYKEIYSNDVTFEDVEQRMVLLKKIIDQKEAAR